MSKLLINEPPLQVLPTLARLIGLNEAIVLQQIHYWLNMPNTGKEIEGRRWVYNSAASWQEQNFPFWSTRTIQRIFARIIELDLLLSDNFNPIGFDRTRWYTIDYDWLAFIEENDIELVEYKPQKHKNLQNFLNGASITTSCHDGGGSITTSCRNACTDDQSVVIHYDNLSQPIPETTRNKSDIDLTFKAFLADLRRTLPQAVYTANLQSAQLHAIENNTLIIAVNSSLAAARINAQLAPQLSHIVTAHYPDVTTIRAIYQGAS